VPHPIDFVILIKIFPVAPHGNLPAVKNIDSLSA